MWFYHWSTFWVLTFIVFLSNLQYITVRLVSLFSLNVFNCEESYIMLDKHCIIYELLSPAYACDFKYSQQQLKKIRLNTK